MRIPDEYTALNVSEILTEAFHLQMSFKKRIDDYAEWEKLRGAPGPSESCRMKSIN